MKKSLPTVGLTIAIVTSISPAQTMAAQATSPVITVSVPINAPTCTVANTGGNSITLPQASMSQTIGTYQSLYLPTLGLATSTRAGNYYTSSALNQTATITCSAANTPITGIVVQPGPSATLYSPGYSIQFLVDATTPKPVTAAGGNFPFTTEQVSINGSAAPWSYHDDATGQPRFYTTPFTTGQLSTGGTPVSTASVVWRPQFAVGAAFTGSVFGNPTGGSYNGSLQIVVNY